MRAIRLCLARQAPKRVCRCSKGFVVFPRQRCLCDWKQPTRQPSTRWRQRPTTLARSARRRRDRRRRVPSARFRSSDRRQSDCPPRLLPGWRPQRWWAVRRPVRPPGCWLALTGLPIRSARPLRPPLPHRRFGSLGKLVARRIPDRRCRRCLLRRESLRRLRPGRSAIGQSLWPSSLHREFARWQQPIDHCQDRSTPTERERPRQPPVLRQRGSEPPSLRSAHLPLRRPVRLRTAQAAVDRRPRCGPSGGGVLLRLHHRVLRRRWRSDRQQLRPLRRAAAKRPQLAYRC